MLKFRRILVPHDFSEHAARALQTAADLARGNRGRILVLNVIVPFSPVAALPPAEATVWIPPLDLVQDQQQRLAALAARLVKGPKRPAVDARVVVGDPYERIIAASKGMDLIVMATHGRTGLAHLVIGSVAEKVVRHSTVPVLTLRGGGRPRGARAARRPRKTRRR